MATMTAGTKVPLNFKTLSIAELFNYDFATVSATSARYYDDANNETVFGGFGFAFNAAKEPTRGIVTSIRYEEAGATIFQATGLSVGATALLGFAQTNDTMGALQLALRGADTIKGSAFGDFLSGFGGNDKVFGGAGSDVLIGGAGKDRLQGDAGKDFLTGDRVDGLNTETDTFVFTRGSSGIDGTSTDVITNWKAIDQIDMSIAGTSNNYREAATKAIGIVGAAKFAESKFTGKEDVTHVFLYNGKDGFLLSDLNNDNKYETGVVLKGGGSNVAFSHSDIL